MKSEQRYENLSKPGYKSLLAVDGVDEAKADKLAAADITSAAEFAEADIADIMRIVGVDEDQAAVLKLQAADIPVPEVEPAVMTEADRLFSAPVEQKEEGKVDDDQMGNRISDDEPAPPQDLNDEIDNEPMPGNTVEPTEMDGNTVEQPAHEQEMPSVLDRADGNRLL